MPRRPQRTPRSPRKRKASGSRWKKRLAVTLLVALVLAAATLLGLIGPFWQLGGQFGSRPAMQPSRLYGRALLLDVGDPSSIERLRAQLDERGYDERETLPTPLGTFVVQGDRLLVARQRFPTSEGTIGGDRLTVQLRAGAIVGLDIDGQSTRRALLDPPLIASYYGPALRERRPVSIDAVPEDLIYAVLAIEDAGFLEHRGVSITGALRAAWVNLRAQGVRQGGSTLTQQLVKNLYLTHERTFVRKLREAALALMLEARYDKRAILEAYLNEIYWGRSGSIDLMGVGAAAWAYFGKGPAQLDLAESALLAGIIQSPGTYAPLRHPERAKARRDQVLARLGQLRWVDETRLAAAAQAPLGIRPTSLVARRAPYFADAVADEARRRFGIEDLRDAGFVLLSTLDLEDQSRAEEAVTSGLRELEDGWEKDARANSPLQAALISIDPRDGAVRAWVGGRDYGRSQFDRVSSAKRQAGSAFKPIVFAAAYEAGIAPVTPVEDAPFTHVQDGKPWRPRNSDDTFRGWVSTRVALERSLNVPTAKLGLRVGLNTVVDLAHDLGVTSRLDPYPALALGAMEVSPRELVTVYGTFAAAGERPTVHALTAAFDRNGDPRTGLPVPPPKRVLRADVAYLVTHVLQGVLDVGTAQSVRRQGLEDRLAGKTGTTNSRRDSWFAGYAPSRATVVWVGYDDNAGTRLSGARAALPIWTRFTQAARPRGGYPGFGVPRGVVRALVDPATGQLATTRCDRVITELFVHDLAPNSLCPLHDGWRARPLAQPDELEAPRRERENPFRRWLDRVRGRRDGT